MMIESRHSGLHSTLMQCYIQAWHPNAETQCKRISRTDSYFESIFLPESVRLIQMQHRAIEMQTTIQSAFLQTAKHATK